jgi:predicted MarR family transcription regulator
VNYALKKLTRLGLVSGDKRGKEIFYATTKDGQAACEKYREVREDCLVSAFSAFGGDPTSEGGAGELNEQIGEAADLLRALSGLYDQAARSASSL